MSADKTVINWQVGSDRKYHWNCPKCHKKFTAETQQKIGMTRSNHLEVHGIEVR